MGYYCYSTFHLRMVDMIEKYKEEEPDKEFVELDVMERVEAKFIVRETSRPTSESSSKELNLGCKLNQTWNLLNLSLTASPL